MSWTLRYLDGRVARADEKAWQEVSIPRQYGRELLETTAEPAASLMLTFAGRTIVLRAPDQQTHFFRYTRARVPIDALGPLEVMYQAMGYVCAAGIVRVEIDPRGNVTHRFEYADGLPEMMEVYLQRIVREDLAHAR